MDRENSADVITGNSAPPIPVLGQDEPPAPPGMIRVKKGSHHVWTAVVCSLVIMGGGQFYNKQWQKGLIFIAIGIVLRLGTMGILSTAGAEISGDLWLIGAIVLGIAGITDGRAIAKRLVRGELVRRWQWF